MSVTGQGISEVCAGTLKPAVSFFNCFPFEPPRSGCLERRCIPPFSGIWTSFLGACCSQRRPPISDRAEYVHLFFRPAGD